MNLESNPQREFHVAPMLDVSKPEFLNLMRILSKRAILWTEMIVDETIIYSDDVDSHLAFEPHLSPIICQIGGRNADFCGKVTNQIATSYGYEEINLNIDCPSSRVSGKRKFGAILMKDVITAQSIVSAMKSNANPIKNSTRVSRKSKDMRTPKISVKTRVGIELEDGKDFDTMDHLIKFIEKLRSCGCQRFIIHARKCVLGGLSPAQNRLIPPLNYPRVYTLCHHFPDCEFVINGGIPGLKASLKILCDEGMKEPQQHNNSGADYCLFGDTREEHSIPCTICNLSNGSCTAPPTTRIKNLTGVMLGRALIDYPSMFWDIDRYFYGEASNPTKNRREVLEKYCEYLEVTYPRRCCDNSHTITSKIPAPKVERTREYCHICSNNRFLQKWDGQKQKDKIEEYRSGSKENEITTREKMRIKITSRVIDRSLKPILNLFFGLRKSKHFRRECYKLSRDERIRNCGPSFILQMAVRNSIPDELLDEPFIKTEDLDEKLIPVHSAPVVGSCNHGTVTKH